MGQCAGLWVFIEVAGGPGWWQASEASSHPLEPCTPFLENPSLGGRVQSRQRGRGAFQGAVQAGRGGGGSPAAPETRLALPGSARLRGCAWGGVRERGGCPVCFGGLAAARAIGELSQLLVGAVQACLESQSHWQSETQPHSTQCACGDPGTQGWAGRALAHVRGWGGASG